MMIGRGRMSGGGYTRGRRVLVSERALVRVLHALLEGAAVREGNGAERFFRAPEGSPLGRIAFADQREEVPVGLEPNNELEQRVFNELDFFMGANSDLSPEVLDTIRVALTRGHYDDVLYLSSAPTFYRGLHLSEREAGRLLGLSPDDLPGPGEQRKFKRPFELRSIKESGASSWTTDYGVALEFGEEMAWEDDTWAVVLVARAADNPGSFLDLEELYRIVNPYHEHQRECVALGPVRVSEFRVIKPG
jgi:hypothetical protein